MKTALFACIHNAGRSQMAAAFFNKMVNPTKARAISAGTNPDDKVHPNTVTVMSEVGIDLSDKKPKKISLEILKNADIFVTMGCEEGCPTFPSV